MLSGGFSGVSAWTHSDVGGRTVVKTLPFGLGSSYRSKELLMRWMELSAFSDAIFRTFETQHATSNAQVWDDLQFLKRFQTIHTFLNKYRRQQMKASFEKNGLPLVRHMLLNFHSPETPLLSVKLEKQFAVGTALIVCPVLQPKKVTVKCFLPPKTSKWFFLWDNSTIVDQTNNTQGEWINCNAPLGFPCVFHDGTIDFSPILDELGIDGMVDFIPNLDEFHDGRDD